MIKIDRDKVAEEILNLLYNYKPIVKITDESGKMNVPIGNFMDFCQDFGLLIATIIEEYSEFDDSNIQ